MFASPFLFNSSYFDAEYKIPAVIVLIKSACYHFYFNLPEYREPTKSKAAYKYPSQLLSFITLARKTTRGIFWVTFSNIFIKVINFTITVILARLLDPEHFGLVSLGLVVVNFFEIFRDMGIGTALIYKKDEVDKAANTAFFSFRLLLRYSI